MSTWEIILQLLITGLANGLIIALIALGYTMVYGIVELINFAHGDVMMLGCFLALTLVGLCGGEAAAPWLAIGLMLLLVPPFCATLNWVIDRHVYRPLRSAPKLTVLVSAIGVSFVCVNLGMFWGGLPMEVFGDGKQAASAKSFPELLGYYNLLGEQAAVQLTYKELMVALITVPLMILLTWFVSRTRLGTAMRAVAQNPTAAQLMGIDVNRVIGLTFLIGGALAGVASVIAALYTGSISFQMGYRNGLDAFTAAVLGGIGNITGALVGGLMLGLLENWGAGLFGGQWKDAIAFAVLVLVLMMRPTGLLGETLGRARA